MSKTLYVFADSERPDVYLNVIAHCVLYQDVDTVELLHIRGLRDKNLPSDKGLAVRINSNLQRLVGSLATKATYIRFYVENGERKEEEIDLTQEHTTAQVAAIKDFYEQLIPRLNCRPERDKEYNELSRWFKAAATRDNRIIIDITADTEALPGGYRCCSSC